MKKLLTILVSALLVVVGCFALTACNKEEVDPAVGTYKIETLTAMGQTYTLGQTIPMMGALSKDTVVLTLKKDGKASGSYTIPTPKTLDGTWTKKDGKITINFQDENPIVATLDGDKLTGDISINVGMPVNATVVLVKQTEKKQDSAVGVYKLESISMGQTTLNIGDYTPTVPPVQITADFVILTLNKDGSASFLVSFEKPEPMTGTWTRKDSKITVTIDQQPQIFTINGNKLTVNDEGSTIVLVKQK